MTSIYQLTKRNILLFLKNKTTVFFSFLAPVLILLLYSLFLGEMQIDSIKSMIPSDIEVSDNTLRGVADAWMMAGVISISCLSIGLNSMLVMISDREHNIINDFISSPIKQSKFLLCYFLASFILTFALNILVLLVGILYLALISGVFLSFAAIMELLLVLFISCMFSVTFMSCVMSAFKSNASASAFNGVFSALVGFIIGAYLPLGMQPDFVQIASGAFPATHTTGLLRTIFMNTALAPLSSTVPVEFIEQIKELYSFNLNLFGINIGMLAMYIYLLSSTILFFGLYLLINRLRKKP